MLCEVFPLLFGNSGKPMDFGLGKNYHSTQQNATLHKNKSCMYLYVSDTGPNDAL